MIIMYKPNYSEFCQNVLRHHMLTLSLNHKQLNGFYSGDGLKIIGYILQLCNSANSAEKPPLILCNYRPMIIQ